MYVVKIKHEDTLRRIVLDDECYSYEALYVMLLTYPRVSCGPACLIAARSLL